MQQLDHSPDISTATQDAATSLAASIEARTAICAVMGLGFVGTTAMRILMHAGFEVHGYDRVTSAVERFRARASEYTDASQSWSAGTDASVLKRADVVLLAVHVLPEPNGRVNTEPLMEAAKALQCHSRSPRLILIESTVPSLRAPPGFLHAIGCKRPHPRSSPTVPSAYKRAITTGRSPISPGSLAA